MPVDETAPDEGGHRRCEGEGDGYHAGVHGLEPESLLQVQRRQEEQGRERAEVRGRHQQPVAVGAQLEESEPHHGRAPGALVVPLPLHESRARDDEDHQREPPARVIRRSSGREDERQHQGERRDAEQGDAD